MFAALVVVPSLDSLLLLLDILCLVTRDLIFSVEDHSSHVHLRRILRLVVGLVGCPMAAVALLISWLGYRWPLIIVT